MRKPWHFLLAFVVMMTLVMLGREAKAALPDWPSFRITPVPVGTVITSSRFYCAPGLVPPLFGDTAWVLKKTQTGTAVLSWAPQAATIFPDGDYVCHAEATLSTSEVIRSNVVPFTIGPVVPPPPPAPVLNLEVTKR